MTTIASLIASTALRKRLTHYIAAYVSEELDRGHGISDETISDAIDAFEGGAADDTEGATPNKPLCTPWSLHFDRDGTEDIAIICDGDGHDLATSRHFWLPEGNDPVPATLASMRLMVAAPKLLDACDLVQRAHVGDGVSMAEAVDACLLAITETTGRAA